MTRETTPQRYLRIRNWTRFQHYRDRQPPWVKLHVQILDDGDLAALPPSTQLLAYKLLLVAARTENRIPDSAKIVAGWTQLPTKTVTTSLQHLQKIGFLDSRSLTDAEQEMASKGQLRLEDASAVLAEPPDLASTHARPRARGETEELKALPSSGFSPRPADAPPDNGSRPLPGLSTLERLIADAAPDEASAGVIRAEAQNLPENILALAHESLRGRRDRHPPLTNPAGYVVNALRAIARDHGHPRPPADF